MKLWELRCANAPRTASRMSHAIPNHSARTYKAVRVRYPQRLLTRYGALEVPA